MAINIGSIISSLIQQYSIFMIALPFKEPAEVVLQNIFKTTTLPMFSQFSPNTIEHTCWTRDLEILDRHNNLYRLPAEVSKNDIISVIDVSTTSYGSVRGAYGDIAPAYGINRSLQGVATSQAYMLAVSQMRAEPSFDYKGYNKIELLNYPAGRIKFIVSTVHDVNGETLEPGNYDSIMELATLDLKIFLYNNLKHYDNIQTANGETNLKIEEFQSAEADRNALLDRWRDTFHFDMIDWIEFM